MKAVVLFSGGIDSTCALKVASEVADEVLPLFFFYGQNGADLEWEAAVSTVEAMGLNSESITRLDVSDLYRESTIPYLSEGDISDSPRELQHNVVIPGRNAWMLAMGASRAFAIGANWLVTGMGCLSDVENREQSGMYDVTSKFLRKMESALLEGILGTSEKDMRFSIYNLLMKRHKGEMLLEVERQYPGFVENIIPHTRTCHSITREPCGKCRACRDREYALEFVKESKS